jgi:hypothetical protein
MNDNNLNAIDTNKTAYPKTSMGEFNVEQRLQHYSREDVLEYELFQLNDRMSDARDSISDFHDGVKFFYGLVKALNRQPTLNDKLDSEYQALTERIQNSYAACDYEIDDSLGVDDSQYCE